MDGFAVLMMSVGCFFGCKKSVSEVNTKVGGVAPDFELYDSDGLVRTLSEFKGSPVVLYFFPKAGTPGCTKQACSLRDKYSDFIENNIVVLGISYDTVERLDRFKREYRLPFYLLSDAKKKVATLYGANRLFFMNLFPRRMTFIIDKSGRIADVLPDVSIDTHSDTILKFIKSMKD
ncbi:peroxiredoxin [Candidatus Babeliales bacterium]|nr:peroxiredoxin [Candidatus Babeliales bacterium]